MATKRIYQIAKEFNSDEKKIIEFLTGQGIKVANRLSAVSEDTYKLLKEKLFAPPPPPPPPPPKPEPKVEPVVEKKAEPVVPPNVTKTEPLPAQGKKKKKKKNVQSAEQVDENNEQVESLAKLANAESINAATQAVANAALLAGNEFIHHYIPAKKQKKELRTHLSRNMDIWGLLETIRFDSPDSSPIRYWQAVNKLTTRAFKLVDEYGLKNREILAEMRETVKCVGAKYAPQEVFTEEENQLFEAQQNFLFKKFGHGMGKVNDNLYALKMYAENKKAYCEHINFVDYLTNPDNMLETKIPMPFEVLAETVLYSIRSIPCHVDFFKENKERISKSLDNFFNWTDGYKKLKEQNVDAAKVEKYLYLEKKFFKLVEFMSFDNLVYLKRKKPMPFDVLLDLLNEYRDNIDDPDAERNFKYKVRGITNITYKPKEYVFIYEFGDLEPQKDYRPPEEIVAEKQ